MSMRMTRSLSPVLTHEWPDARHCMLAYPDSWVSQAMWLNTDQNENSKQLQLYKYVQLKENIFFDICTEIWL